MPKPTVLLVDDNQELRETVAENLELDGYYVVSAGDAEEMLRHLRKVSPDTILLDLILPDADGLSLIAKIRDFTDAPVIVISGKIEMVDKVVGLEMGADDYIAKPFEMRELSARVKANVRRYRPDLTGHTKKPMTTATVISFHGLNLDRAKMQLFDAQGQSLDLTIMEFRLLEALMMAPDRVLSRGQLLHAARQENPDVYDRAIDVQITRLRKKMSARIKAEDVIKTVRGAGYMFATDVHLND
jgi:DNA-binding response OmpR family regulator